MGANLSAVRTAVVSRDPRRFDLLPTTAELEALPVLSQGQADDLHLDSGEGLRVWLARVGVADGSPVENMVTIELRTDGCWADLCTYDGDDPSAGWLTAPSDDLDALDLV